MTAKPPVLIETEDEIMLATRAAWLYYSGGRTQSQVAALLDVAPAKAHRLIARATKAGVVRVFVEGPMAGCMQLEQHLARSFGLGFCRVVPDIDAAPLPLRSLGMAGAAVLLHHLETGDHRVIGVGHGRTLAAAVDHLPRLPTPELCFVSLLGGVPRHRSASPYDVIHRLAEKTGAEAYLVPVPFFANSPQDRAVLVEQRGVAEALGMAATATLFFVGIGDIADSAFLSASGMIAPEEVAALRAAGAVGEVLGRYLDSAGEPIETPLHERVIGLPLSAMRGREVIALAGGAEKTDALLSVLRSGVLSGLITDEPTARRLLERLTTREPTTGRKQCTRKPATSRLDSWPDGSADAM